MTVRGLLPSLGAGGSLIAAAACALAVFGGVLAFRGENPPAAQAIFFLATRIAEPHLTTWLQKGPEPAAEVALELFDRSFRFGPADQDSLVSVSLAAYAGRAEGTLAARARRVHERSLDPPQSKRPTPVPAAVRPDSTPRRAP